MTDYALQATIYTDKSKMEISNMDYDRAGLATLATDSSSLTINDVKYDRAMTASIFTDKSKIEAILTKLNAYIATIYTDKSQLSLRLQKSSASSASIYIPGATANIFISALRYTQATLSSGISSGMRMFMNVTKALKGVLEVDSSSFNISKLERDILTEAPTGQTYVIIKGVDVSLNGYALARNSVHAINILIYGDRLTQAGTNIEFIVKRNISDPDDSAVIYSSTVNGQGIKFIQVKSIPETTLKEYKAQIQLKESDFYLISQQRPIKLYYEVRVIDSLDGRYPPVEAGYFNLTTTLIENRF